MSRVPDCPFCGAGAVERVGQWGGQIITAQWRRLACDSYFEAVRKDFDEPLPTDAAGQAASRTASRELK